LLIQIITNYTLLIIQFELHKSCTLQITITLIMGEFVVRLILGVRRLTLVAASGRWRVTHFESASRAVWLSFVNASDEMESRSHVPRFKDRVWSRSRM